MKSLNVQQLPREAQESFKQELENHPELQNKVVLWDGATSIEQSNVRALLDAGKTISIINAKREQLAVLSEATGCGIEEDVSFFAIKRSPVPGHPHVNHTVCTIINENDEQIGQMANKDGGVQSLEAPIQKPDYQFICAQLTHHVNHDFEDANAENSNFIPPNGAKWGKQTFNYPHFVNHGPPRNLGPRPTSETQGIFSSRQMTLYVYDANGNQSQEEYVVFAVMKGQLITQYNGSSLIMNAQNGRGYAAAGFDMGVALTNNMNYVSSSPAPTTLSPVSDSGSYQMEVMKDSSGGKQPASFMVSHSNSVSNEGWGVSQTDQASWKYYNCNDKGQGNTAYWNTISDTVSNFTQWCPQVDDNGKILSLPAQALNGMNSEAIAIWTAPKSNPKISFRLLRKDLYYFWAINGSTPHFFFSQLSGSVALGPNLQTIINS